MCVKCLYHGELVKERKVILAVHILHPAVVIEKIKDFLFLYRNMEKRRSFYI